MSTPPPQQQPGIPAYGSPYVPPPAPGSAPITPSTNAHLLSGVGGVFLAGLMLLVGSGAAGQAMLRMRTYDLSFATTLPLVLFGLAAVVIATLLGLTIKLSSVGAYISGAVMLLIGLVGFVSPRALFTLSGMIRNILRGTDIFILSGAPILMGAVLIGAGLAGTLIRRSRPAAS